MGAYPQIRHGVTPQKAGHHGQARNTFSSFQFRVFPIPASRPMPSGFFMCMALPPTENTRPEVHRSHGRRASQAGRSSPNGHQPEPVKNSWSALAAQTPNGHAGGSTEPNAGARQTLRTVWSGGQVCAKPYKSLHIFHIEATSENESPNGARQTLHTVSFRAQSAPDRTSASPGAKQNRLIFEYPDGTTI